MIEIPGYTLSKRIYASKKSLVYLGHRDSDGLEVLVKMPQSAYPSERALKHFHASHEIANKFNHPGIVNSIDVGISNNRHYAVFEYHGTVDLRIYQSDKPEQVFGIDEFLDIGIKLANILSNIHHKNVIFKDLHPGNILINPKTQEVQLADFGLASIVTRELKSLDPPEYVEGVLGFVSPEQTGRMNRSLDYRSDFYSLGVCFYVMLTGKMPFNESDDLATIHANIAKHHIPITNHRHDIPDVITRIIDRLLEKNAEDRYQSASGLKVDLQKCQKFWSKEQAIPEFNLGEEDISSILEFPQRLYGRETELDHIRQVIQRVAKGTPELLFITGPAGVGKTSLVREIQHQITPDEGDFIYGQIHTQAKSTPFLPFRKALKAWINYSLSRDETNLDQLRQRLELKLEHHLDYLLEFLPELSFLFSEKQLDHNKTKTTTQKNELRFALHQFIKIISLDKPLILFIDNLQWADADSQSLFKSLSLILESKLLLIGCYRSNSVRITPRLKQLLKQTEKNIKATTIELSPLGQFALKQLLSDTLKTDPSAVEELSYVTKQKTLGYPNLVHSFLENLYYKKLINFNLKSKSWHWDITRIKQQEVDSRTAKLICERIKLLPKDTRRLIGIAGAIGSHFEIELLVDVTDSLSIEPIQAQVSPAVDLGILNISRDQPNQYQFAHSKVRKEAYKLLNLQERSKTHHRIAQALIKADPTSGSYTFNYSVADHLNKSRKLITKQPELNQAAALNLKAALAAKQQENWPTTYNYCVEGLQWLDNSAWETSYGIVKNLIELKLDTLLKRGFYQQASELLENNLTNLSTVEEKANWCAIMAAACQSPQQVDTAIQYSLKGLNLLGINFDITHKELESNTQSRIIDLIARFGIEQVQTYTPSKATANYIQRLYGQLGLALYLSNHPAFFRLTEKAFIHAKDHGFTEDSVFALTFAAITAAECEQLSFVNSLIKAALWLLEKHPHSLYSDVLYGLIGARLQPYQLSLKQAYHTQYKGFLNALHKQQYNAACSIHLNAVLTSFANSTPLEKIGTQLEDLEKQQRAYQLEAFETQLLKRFVLALSQKRKHSKLEREDFGKDQWKAISRSSSGNLLNTLRHQYYFWSDQLDKLLAAQNFGHSYDIQNIAVITDFELMMNITYCRSMNNGYKQRIEAYIESLDHLQKTNPGLYGHKYLLLKAEHSLFTQQPQLKTVKLYEQALKAAGESEFIQFQAYINERLGDLWHGENNSEYAFINYRKALYLYRRWNCQLKAHTLAKKTDALKRRNKRRNTKSRFLDNVVPISSSRRNLTDNIDLMTVLRSSQAISRNMPLDSLLHQILTLILQNSGAQVASILLKKEQGLVVANYLDTNNTEVIDQQAKLPEEIINYVKRSRNVLLIQNTEVPSHFGQNRTVQARKVKSLLCSPILYRDSFMGVLYLENRKTTNAFTLQRLNIINALLNQASISLENTRYHQDLEQLNKNLEHMVNARTKDLQIINSELEDLSFSMSHDLKAPLRSIKGFTQALVEDFGTDINASALDYLDRIQKGSDKTTNMMQGLNDLYRSPIQQFSYKMVNPSQIANRLIQKIKMAYPEHKPNIENLLPLTFEADEQALYTVLETLIDNAFKFTQKVSHPVIELGFDEKSARPHFYVKDNGVGFDISLKHRLFHHFQQLHNERDYQGAGLGLASAKKTVERHNGKIWASAIPNKGSTFFFYLGQLD